MENTELTINGNKIDHDVMAQYLMTKYTFKTYTDTDEILVFDKEKGYYTNNGEVTIKKLFTYDAVADPGFSSARMELRTINESLGLIGVNEGANFRIYDISDESKINELFNMDKNEFVTNLYKKICSTIRKTSYKLL